MGHFLALAALFCVAPGVFATDAATNYQQHCVACHGAGRLGVIGPAQLPENLERLRKADAVKVIGEGRPVTQMPGFSASLTQEEIAALAEWLYNPAIPRPQWQEAEIRASHIKHFAAQTLGDKPVFRPIRSISSSSSSRAIITFPFSTAIDLSVFIASPRATRCMAGRSLRRTDAMSFAPCAMAGCRVSTSIN